MYAERAEIIIENIRAMEQRIAQKANSVPNDAPDGAVRQQPRRLPEPNQMHVVVVWIVGVIAAATVLIGMW